MCDRMSYRPLSRERQLSTFIRKNLEPILHEWEQFAQQVVGGRRMSSSDLRDHAAGMLMTSANEIEYPQTLREQIRKGRGRAAPGPLESEAERHGAARVAIGLTVSQAVSEFRALRASVLRLWSYANGKHPPNDQTIRFNEAVDQALAESLQRYSLDKDETTRRFDTLLSDSPDLQFIIDADGRFIYANQTLTRLFCAAGDQVNGKTVDELCPGVAPQVKAGIAETIRRGQHHTCELVCEADPQKTVTYRVVFLPVLDAEGSIESLSGNARNISELKASEEQIMRQAYYDSLTGLPNRSLFLDRLEQETRHASRTGRKLALFYLDLDGFKGVNDRFGHAQGDALLQETARRLTACVRASDTVARLGGDEFTILLTDFTSYAHVELIAREILSELSRPFSLQGTEVRVSCSIGITLHPDDALQPDDLVRNADQAMFAAKKAGRDRFSYFTRAMHDSANERLKTIDALRRALDNGELSVYYQPIVDMANGHIVKAEALLRWHHPEHGLTLPSEFIGLAEETGLIREIGSRVLDEVLTRARRWSSLRGAPFPVSINRSPVEFMTVDKLARGDRDLDLLQAAGNTITVEITEGVMLNDSASVRDKLHALRQAGVQIAIDDFGVGYSSMALLKRFKVDFLKIDHSFVKDIMLNREGQVFAETIVCMAHKLGLQVIAEGIETVEQHAWLKDIGCDFGQGFLFAEATAADRFEAMLIAA